jgi:hypothetical protein
VVFLVCERWSGAFVLIKYINMNLQWLIWHNETFASKFDTSGGPFCPKGAKLFTFAGSGGAKLFTFAGSGVRPVLAVSLRNCQAH